MPYLLADGVALEKASDGAFCIFICRSAQIIVYPLALREVPGVWRAGSNMLSCQSLVVWMNIFLIYDYK
jgi:hypothetical protein